MGELIDFTRVLRDQNLAEQIAKFNENFVDDVIPEPEEFGWIVAERIDETPVRYFHPAYQAFIGYIPGEPDFVFLDYNHEIRSYYMSLRELALGLQFGTLPEPEAILDSNFSE